MFIPARRLGLALCLVVAASVVLLPQDADYVRVHYTKYEFEVPMRDGVKLFTSVYVPKDRSETYPIMLTRTPYSVAPYGPDTYRTNLGPSDIFMKDEFTFVYQDVRGAWMSEGTYADIRPLCADEPAAGARCIDESTDTYDTIDWLIAHVPYNNGRVGMWGISYPGYYTSAGMIAAHPALKAASPQAPVTEWFMGDDFHHNGALYLAHAFRFFSGFGTPRPEPTSLPRPGLVDFSTSTPDGYRFYLDLGPLANVNEKYFHNRIAFWNDLLEHPNYDAFWQARDVRRHLNKVTPAVLTVGGWFDAEDLYGALATYKAVEKQNPGASNRLVMGPWFHGGWARSSGEGLGSVRFGSRTSEFYREKIEFPFFAGLLKDRPDPALPDAYVFDTGRDEWRTFDAWPPAEVTSRSIYLQPGGRLSFDPPGAGAARGYDEYVSDPMKPVPFAGDIVQNMTREHMVADQRFASTRPDVLTYASDVLAEDVTVAGPLHPRLVVSTSGTDSDFVVKLIDVYPDTYPAALVTPDAPSTEPSVTMGGYQQLVRGEVMRGRFRNSFEKPEAFQPDAPTAVDYVIPDVFHTFRRGHRIMIQVQSSWFPLVDRNPQTFVDIGKATDADFRAATNRVYRSAKQASRVEVSILR
ncbi:MAG TPA: CocE/NonD family hydrolase [Vicinamibacterales bacterium]|nr:CocE/NonD family hydrolase [Vicinamibacterales bacterium]